MRASVAIVSPASLTFAPIAAVAYVAIHIGAPKQAVSLSGRISRIRFVISVMGAVSCDSEGFAAFEVFGNVGAAATLVNGGLRKGAERPRPIDHAVRLVPRLKARRCDALLDPALEIRHGVVRLRSLAARSARPEEKPVELLRMSVPIEAGAAAGDDGLLVILDAADGSVRRAAPQMRLEKLAAAIAVR